MTLTTEIAIFDLLPGADLLDHGSQASQHFRAVLEILRQQRGFLRLFWVRHIQVNQPQA